jgi:ferrous iron transport protein B
VNLLLLPTTGSRDTRHSQPIQTVALIGPPNSGKSTLFNRLTNLRQKVGNYPGITVEQHTGTMSLPTGDITLIDLPGIYSLTPHSEDERVAVVVLQGMSNLPKPDAVLLVLDVTNLGRHLTLFKSSSAIGHFQWAQSLHCI